jgi:hypothetical protein
MDTPPDTTSLLSVPPTGHQTPVVETFTEDDASVISDLEHGDAIEMFPAHGTNIDISSSPTHHRVMLLIPTWISCIREHKIVLRGPL